MRMSSDAAQLDYLIRRTLATSVSQAEPSGEVLDRILLQCRSSRAPRTSASRALIAAALGILVEVLQVDAVCHSAALPNSLAVLVNLRAM